MAWSLHQRLVTWPEWLLHAAIVDPLPNLEVSLRIRNWSIWYNILCFSPRLMTRLKLYILLNQFKTRVNGESVLFLVKAFATPSTPAPPSFSVFDLSVNQTRPHIRKIYFVALTKSFSTMDMVNLGLIVVVAILWFDCIDNTWLDPWSKSIRSGSLFLHFHLDVHLFVMVGLSNSKTCKMQASYVLLIWKLLPPDVLSVTIPLICI